LKGFARGSASGWAFLATLYWAGMAVLYALTVFSSLALLAGAGAFVLLCWAIRDGAGARPAGASFWFAGLSALYTAGTCWTFGFAAYVEGHGCALQPETCTGGGLALAWKVAISAAILYFGVAWLVNRSAEARRHRARPVASLRLAGGPEDRQEGG
jgi:hypothetical protein